MLLTKRFNQLYQAYDVSLLHHILVYKLTSLNLSHTYSYHKPVQKSLASVNLYGKMLIAARENLSNELLMCELEDN